MATAKKPVSKPAVEPATKPREFVVLEPFFDRDGRRFDMGDSFPFSNYSAADLKIYTTAENKIGRAVVKEQ